MKKFTFALIVTALSAIAVKGQVQSQYKLAWDYSDLDLANYNVMSFQLQYDSGTWTDVGIPVDIITIPGGKTYLVPLLVDSGTHSVSVRACNVNLCSDPLGPLAYVKPGKAGNIKILGGK